MEFILDLFGIPVAKAASDVSPELATFVGKIDRYIVNPLIILMFAGALVYFLYGVFDFISNAQDSEKRGVGKDHMIWGIIGMFIMFAVFTIIKIIENTLGAEHNTLLQ